MDNEWLKQILSTGTAFQTTGCVGCNRPFYNERPKGPMYNYPRNLSNDEVTTILEELKLDC